MRHEIHAPLLNPNEPLAILTRWHVTRGTKVKKGDLLCDLTTSKVTMEIVADAEGFIVPLVPRGSQAKAGDLMAVIHSTIEAADMAGETLLPPSAAPPAFSRDAVALINELKLSQEMFRDLKFVTAQDVRNRSSSTDLASVMHKQAESKLLGLTIREALRSSLTLRVHFKTEPQEFLSPYGIPAFWSYHVSQVLKAYPKFVAGGDVDIGYAIDSGAGPRQFLAASADKWSKEKWQERLTEWSLASARNKISSAELGIGRFSITDLSSFGVFQFEPLLVGRQSAILGIGGDSEAGRREFTLTLAFDHRVHNGLEAAEFLRAIRQRVMI